jgi:hypothetical protein
MWQMTSTPAVQLPARSAGAAPHRVSIARAASVDGEVSFAVESAPPKERQWLEHRGGQPEAPRDLLQILG